jgi:uncharacterized ion transporter superfamily protein YfcC
MVSNGTGERGWTNWQVSRIKEDSPKSEQEERNEQARVHRVGIENRGKMKNKDSKRKWMWWFLGVVLALQLYFVRELLAAFALFALGFAAIAFVVMSLYMLQKVWEAGVQRVADSQHPVVDMARRGVNAVEDLARRPLRRPGSAAAR